MGRGPGRGQGQGLKKKTPRPGPLTGAGRGIEAGARRFLGPGGPVTNTTLGSCRRLRTADRRQPNTRVLTVGVSTTTGSQSAAPVMRTPAAPRRIIQGSASTPTTFKSFSVPPYSSPLATRSVTTSGVRSPSGPGDPRMSQHEHIWAGNNSPRNIATGGEPAVITRVKTLLLQYTLLVDPLPAPATLMFEVHSSWLKALNNIRSRKY